MVLIRGNAKNTTQDVFLRFKQKDFEREFISYLHPRPVNALLALYWIGALAYIPNVLAQPGIGLEINLVWWFLAAIAETAIALIHRKVQHAKKDELLVFERAVLWITAALTAVADHRVTLQHFQSCDVYPSIVIDDRKVFEGPQCRKWLNPIGPIAAAIVVLFGIMPFTWILSLGAVIMVAYATMWLAIPPPDPGVQVGMYAAFAFLGMAFIAFVRYDREQGEREAFLEYHKLQIQRSELAQREKSLTAYCSMLLPRALLRRSAEAMSTGSVDVVEKAAVILVGIHNFGVWCTKRQPMEVTGDVVELQMTVRNAAGQRGADYIGCMGDTTVCTAGLVRSAARPGQTGCALVRSVIRHDSESRFPLRAVVHVGPLRGAFMGEYSVRYDVTGAAYRVAEEALLECPANRCVVSSEGLLAAALAWFEPDGDHDTFVVQEQQFTVITATGHSLINSNEPSIAPTDTSTLASDLLWEAGAPLVPMLTSSITQQQPAVARVPGSPGGVDDNGSASDVQSQRSDGIEVLKNEFERLQQVGTVWCCFPRFLEDDLEVAFVNERMAQLPHAASRMWFAYGLFVLGVLILLLADLKEPSGAISVIMLLVAIGLSVVMGTLPRVLGVERMRRWFFGWSMMAVVLPLLVVYGCALARPAAIGNDPKLYMVIGALVRSYCFASTRWLALTVPLATMAGLGQYALPGAYLRTAVMFVLLLVLGTVAAEREREIVQRDNTRRRVESRLVLSKLRSVARLREGLLRGAVPIEVFALVKRQRLVGVIEADSTAVQHDGVVMAVSVRAPKTTESGVSVTSPLLQLEAMLAQSDSVLTMGGILGDQALVVGPVVVNVDQSTLNAMPKRGERALCAALSTGVSLLDATGSGVLSVVIDYDTVVHAVTLGEFAQYYALGVTVTRMLSILGSADPSTLAGCLLTERVTSLAEELRLLGGYQTALQGPMKFRGVGMVRFAKLTPA